MSLTRDRPAASTSRKLAYCKGVAGSEDITKMPLEEDCAAAIKAEELNKRLKAVFLIDIGKRFLDINDVNINLF
jgi:hypothetical protein